MTADGLAINARGLSKRFGDITAVSGLDLKVPRACIYGFLGPNGCGKSTTIRMLCGLLEPSSGAAEVLGLSVPGDSARLKPRIGYMTQKFSLYGDLTVRENLQFMASIYSLSRAASGQRISELEQRHDLVSQRDQLAGTMSGGQKQRLALACAVLHRPELLLLDEPTSAVDPRSRRDFWACLFELAQGGTTILVSTHYMDEAERCHYLAILDQGVKVADGAPQELKAATGMQVLEVRSTAPERLQPLLESQAQIYSVTQLGLNLRVLIANQLGDGASWVRQLVQSVDGGARVVEVEPSLEDVFVVATGPGPAA